MDSTFRSQIPTRFCSLIKVDDDVTFVVDNRDINYALAVPRPDSNRMTHRTYSKRQPVTYEPVISFRPENMNGSRSFSPVDKKSPFKDSPKCAVMSPEKTGKDNCRKRLIRSDASISKSPVPQKMQKKDTYIKVPSLKLNGHITDKSQMNTNSCNGESSSSDSDIEIIDEIKAGSSRALNNSFNGKEGSRLGEIQKRRNTKSLPSALKPRSPSTYDVTMTEADIAPAIPFDSITPDTGISKTNHNVLQMPPSKKGMYPTRTSDVSSVQNGQICSAKNSDDTSNLCESEKKSPQETRSRRNTELKSLYENLNEISWAREKGFQQLLSNSDNRHSERITAKNVDAGKSLRRLKAGSGNLSMVVNKRKKPSMGSNRKTKPSVSTNKPSVSTNKQIKPSISTIRQTKLSINTNRQIKPSTNIDRQSKPSISTKIQNKPSISTNKLSKSLVKKSPAKLALNRAKFQRLKQKLVLKKNLSGKRPASKMNRKALTIPAAKKPCQKDKVIVKQTSPNAHSKVNTVIKKKPVSASLNKNTKGVEKAKNKLVQSSQTVVGKSSTSALKKLVAEETRAQVEPESSFSGKIVKKTEYSKEVKCVGKQTVVESTTYSTAVKRGSKLRVQVEPIEHTSLWSTSFCEAFSKYVIEQSAALMASKNKDSIKAIFNELMESWLHNLPGNSKNLKKNKPEEETLRSSVRQSEWAFRYKEIIVKKHENFMQFILVPNAVKQNSLTIEAMKELREAFLLAKKDSNCRAVLLSSSGTFFCTGIDLSALVGNGKKQAAEDMALSIKELVLTLGTFTKPLIAAVNGIAVGFGVTILTHCDIVYASDKATFCIPANRLGYLPEGGATLTLSEAVGMNVASEMFMQGRRYTADQFHQKGLVSEVLWHSSLMNDVIPRMKSIVSQPLQVMEATKTMVRCKLWDRLKTQMESEWRLLPPLWLDAQCQKNMKQALQNGWLFD